MGLNYKNEKATEKIREQIITCIEEHGGMIKREQLGELGIDYRRLLDLVDRGELVRIKNGYYTDRIDRFSEEELIARLFPDAKLCMENALFAYGYITQKPFGWRLAVDKNTSKSRFKLEYPKVIPFYTKPEVLQLGASEISIDGFTFGIYDKERVICDCLKYEEKMDRETFKQAMQAYIWEPRKDLSALLEYARERKVISKVQGMIGVWL